ncbi:MAG: hypothetical protein ACM3PP_10030 [Candidatus Saccharibacteria bacterium]
MSWRVTSGPFASEHASLCRGPGTAVSGTIRDIANGQGRGRVAVQKSNNNCTVALHTAPKKHSPVTCKAATQPGPVKIKADKEELDLGILCLMLF